MMSNQIQNNWLEPFADRVRCDAPLHKMCWFQVGGTADYIFKPQSIADLQHFLQSKPADLAVFVLGVGSNILIRDGGFRGCVIRLGRSFNYVRHEDTSAIIAGAATLDLNVALYAAEQGLGGLEFLSGIPGTIGGALAMNAGAYGGEIAQVLISATAMHFNGRLQELKATEIDYCYRGNHLGPDWIFLEGKLKVSPANSELLLARINEIQQQRETTQPIRMRTSGSTFKNPTHHKAWQLIDQAGCRGLRIGGAQVSDMHCNFFLNVESATASDIEQLITIVQKRVVDNSGITLEAEIKIFGEP